MLDLYRDRVGHLSHDALVEALAWAEAATTVMLHVTRHVTVPDDEPAAAARRRGPRRGAPGHRRPERAGAGAAG
ncbi:hypothetical protein GCM10025868_01020 [Angustibacter aerolatus]|uniref:Uncharacterized protein n=1 Tax=Angustibacter aerolatus TaxID=1162965 RepID=A0ABQ6J9K7_9ACTN|nr:hypothetical protein GCM10025868_01020 [Angustibacter aerolatus]